MADDVALREDGALVSEVLVVADVSAAGKVFAVDELLAAMEVLAMIELAVASPALPISNRTGVPTGNSWHHYEQRVDMRSAGSVPCF